MSYYLAGPMRGYPKYNFPRFAAAARFLRNRGLSIVSPHELDLETGFDPEHDTAEAGPTLIGMLKRDMLAVLDSDGVIVLEGWQDSRGATTEVSLAIAAGLPVYTIAQATQLASER